MKPTLQLKLGQQLTLTPQLRQAIKLLQLSAIELDLEINAAIESNPLLELEDEPDHTLAPDNEPNRDEVAPPESTETAEVTDSFDEFPDAQWDSPSGERTGNDNDDSDEREQGGAVPLSLRDHLLWQLRLSHLSRRDVLIGEALIEAIDEDGYLHASFDDLRAGLPSHNPASSTEIETVLRLIQQFDPVGVGARSLSECLMVQLAFLSSDTPGLLLAREVASGHLDALAKIGADRLAQQLRQPTALMSTAVTLLRSLDPKPGTRIGGGNTEFISPDAVAYRQGGVWKVTIASGSQPRLGINRHYQRLIGHASREDDSYLRAQLQEARWLIKCLDTRADTLLRVARSIVRQQSGFLEHGAQAMRPLTLRDVAEELGLHESTISRATTRKYLRTPRGTYEFKYFFSSGISTDSGGGASATAIQAMLKRLIDDENPRIPLSDEKLARTLKVEGIPVARRTVAKYREAMNIPPSNERQRL